MYIEAFVMIYNKQNRGLVYETHKMVKFEKQSVSRTVNLLNLGCQQFYKISKILQSAHVISRDTEGNTFYLNNYID